uniref:Cytochrome P450 n=1 Tax=Angiostrongylus cantonensis TaxID=6313 RepID=A0A0K0DNY6_ANGCA
MRAPPIPTKPVEVFKKAFEGKFGAIKPSLGTGVLFRSPEEEDFAVYIGGRKAPEVSDVIQPNGGNVRGSRSGASCNHAKTHEDEWQRMAVHGRRQDRRFHPRRSRQSHVKEIAEDEHTNDVETTTDVEGTTSVH